MSSDKNEPRLAVNRQTTKLITRDIHQRVYNKSAMTTPSLQTRFVLVNLPLHSGRTGICIVVEVDRRLKWLARHQVPVPAALITSFELTF